MFGFDPFSYLLARLGTSFGPMVAVGIILLILFWGRILGLLRRFVLGVRAATRRSGRKEGELLCADCAAVLGPKTAWAQCPACSGAWLKEADLTALLATKKRPAKEWCAEAGVTSPLCPECGKPLEAGRFVGEDFTVFHCAPCAGLWLGQVERVSLELRVLG